MPRRPRTPALADEHAAEGGVGTIDRALSILSAFDHDHPVRTLAHLATHTRVAKSTLLRMLASLVHARVLRRGEDGAWSLGPELARLAGVYAASFSLEDVVMPAMRELVRRTHESVAFHVRQGDRRLVLFRIDSPHLLRDHARAGDLLPLRRGAGGRVLCAFSGARGHLYEQIRREGLASLVGDRVPGLAGISAPVWGEGGRLLGALTLTAPEQRLRTHFGSQVRQAAAQLSRDLGGHPGARA